MKASTSPSTSHQRDQFLIDTQVRKTESNPNHCERTIALITLNIPSFRNAENPGPAKSWSEPINHWALMIGNQLWELRADGDGSYHSRSKPWSPSKDKFVSSRESIGLSCCTDTEIDEASMYTQLYRVANAALCNTLLISPVL